MTRTTNARLAGITFLAYIATGIADMILFSRAATGSTAALKLASIAQHATAVRLSVLLTLLTFFEAIILAVTLYALTRDEDRDLSALALCCRLTEGILGAAAAVRTMQILAVANALTTVADPSAQAALGASLLAVGGSSVVIGSTCFAVGSLLFSWLFLRARSIPVPLAWLGVIASAIVMIAMPVRLLDFLPSSLFWPIWMPMLVFEVTLAFWLIFKGVTPGLRRDA